MIKLLTLQNLSAFSADAVYKICLSLEKYGLTDENILENESYEQLFEQAETLLAAGAEVIIAAEPADYNSVKQNVLLRFGLEPTVSEKISALVKSSENAFDAEIFSLMPENGIFHLSPDGRYSGFSVKHGEGRLTFLPLDFGRLGVILDSFISNCIEAKQPAPEAGEYAAENDNPLDFSEPVSKMVYSLVHLDASLAVANGEAASWIRGLYGRVEGLSESVGFFDVSEEDEPEEKSGEEDKAEEAEEPKKRESVSAKTIRFAREAMRNCETDFGGAISDVYSAENEDGTMNYFAFVAVADKNGAKAKKINTASYEDAALLLPHCVTVLCETVCQKAEGFTADEKDAENEKPEKGELKLSKGMIAFAVSVAAVAIIAPIIILAVFLRGSAPGAPTTTAAPVFNLTDEFFTTETPTAPPATEATTAPLFPGLTSDETLATIGEGETTSGVNLPNELTAADVTAEITEPPIASTKGTFTFYVFGYGHGVGLSQHGANDLAGQGWSYAQILSNYYYGAVLMSGDTYPKKMKYNGTEYDTRELLACALNAEMGDSFQNEALKAQAVAIYTYAKYYGFKDLDGNDFAYKPNPSEKIYNAVDEVMKAGLFIADNSGQTALTPFHSISAGYTTSYRNTWGNTEVTYLAGGRPSYGDYEADGFKTTVTLTSDQFKSIAQSKGYTLSGDPATWISIISHDTAINDNIGYVSSINVGGKIMTGNDFRQKLLGGSLRSHCFTVVYTPG